MFNKTKFCSTTSFELAHLSFSINVQQAARADETALAIIILFADGLAFFLQPSALQNFLAHLTFEAITMIMLVLHNQRLLLLDRQRALCAILLKQSLPLLLAVHFAVRAFKRVASCREILARRGALDVIAVISLSKRCHTIGRVHDALLALPALRNTRQHDRRSIDFHVKIVSRKILVVIVENGSKRRKNPRQQTLGNNTTSCALT